VGDKKMKRFILGFLLGAMIFGWALSQASIVKVGQGRVAAKQGGSTIADTYEIISGIWTGYGNKPYAGSTSGLVSSSTSATIRFNSEYMQLPTDFVYQFYFYGSDVSTTANTSEIHFRWANNNYYTLRFNWDTDTNSNCTSGTCIDLVKYVNGTPSDLAEVSWTPSASNYYQVKLVVSGTSTTVIKVYVLAVDDTGIGKSRRQYNNQSHIEILPSAIIDVSDASSPHISGELRVYYNNPSAYSFVVGYPTLYASNSMTVSGLSAGQYALYCQAPEIRQAEASQPGVNVLANLWSDSAYGNVKQAQSFQFIEATNLEKLTLFLRKMGSPTGNIVAKICTSYTDCTGGNLVATSDAVTVSSWGGSSPFSYPDEQEFLFSSYPSISAGTDYYFIIEGTTYSSPTANDYISIWKQQGNNPIYGTQYIYRTSWTQNTNDDLVFVLKGREKVRLSALQSGGTATLDLSTMWFDSNATIKIATSATNCYTDLVDASPRTEINAGGDSWEYHSGNKLSVGPMLGCPIDGKVPIWFRGSDYSGGTQYAKIQYTTGSLPSDPTQCSGSCSNSSIVALSSSGDYAGSATLSGLTANTVYNYHVVFCDNSDCSSNPVIQSESAKSFISPPSNSSEVDYKWCGASCFTSQQIPFSHLNNVTSADCKEYWAMGDNIYNHHPGNAPFTVTKSDYRMRQRDTLMETTYSGIYGSVYNCRIFDNHEWAGTPSGVDGTTNNWWDGSFGGTDSGMIISHMYKSSLAGIDDYVMNQYASDAKIRSGSRYIKERWGRSVKIAPDHIYENDGNAQDIAYYYGQNIEYETNPASNPDFESGTTSWTCQDNGGSSCTTFDTVTSPVQNGSNALRVHETTASYAIAQQAITVTASTPYTFRVYYHQNYSSTSGVFRIRTDSYNGGSNICSTQGPGTSGVWTALDCAIPSSNTDTSVYLQLVTASGLSSSIYNYFDNLTLFVPPYHTVGTETKPSCTRNTGNAKQLDCVSQDFTNGSNDPDISTTRGIIVFQNRMYSVDSIVDADTIQTIEDMPTGTDTATRIWKDGKQMYSRQQMIDIADTIKDYDEDSTVDIIMMILSKPLTALASVAPGLEHTDFASEYNYYRNFIMDYCYDNVTKKCSFYTGDRHGFAVFAHTFLNGDTDCTGLDCQWEFLMGNGGAPNPTDLQSYYLASPYKEEIVAEFAFRRGVGVVGVNTNNVSDLSLPKQGLTFEVRDDAGNKIYTDAGSNVASLNKILGSFAILNYEHIYRISRDSSGYCYAFYYDGTNFYAEVSDNISCSSWTGTAGNSRKVQLSGQGGGACASVVLDSNNNTPSMYYNDGILFFEYVNTIGTSPTVCARTMTVNAGYFNT